MPQNLEGGITHFGKGCCERFTLASAVSTMARGGPSHMLMLVVWGACHTLAVLGVGKYSFSSGKAVQILKYALSLCQRARYKILGSITIIKTVRGKNDLIVNRWPHPCNHVLLISKASCLLHSCQLVNETNYIGKWLYLLAMSPWKQWGGEFTLHIGQTKISTTWCPGIITLLGKYSIPHEKQVSLIFKDNCLRHSNHLGIKRKTNKQKKGTKGILQGIRHWSGMWQTSVKVPSIICVPRCTELGVSPEHHCVWSLSIKQNKKKRI